MRLGQRICVVGNSGTGKSTVARSLGDRLGLQYVDRDALVWRAGWDPLPRAERAAAFDEATRGEGWTYDGHLRASRPEEQLVCSRCDTIVWLDLPLWQVMRSIVPRSLRRAIARERLSNGNVEGWRMLLFHDLSVRWAWRNHDRLRDEYSALFADPQLADRARVRLQSRAEMRSWLKSVQT